MSLIEEHEGALNAANIDSLPEAIEHEDVVAQDRFHGSLSVSKGGEPRTNETCGCHVGVIC